MQTSRVNAACRLGGPRTAGDGEAGPGHRPRRRSVHASRAATWREAESPAAWPRGPLHLTDAVARDSFALPAECSSYACFVTRIGDVKATW